MQLIKKYDDSRIDQTKKAMEIYREYNCYAYNCLIILFISTQSKMENFKNFLFYTKTYLWDNLVDTQQTEFGFEV